MPEVYILDVGHGNCAVIVDQQGVFVIDAAPGPTLLELLEKLDINVIDYILISHADEDHIGGLIHLLEQPNLHIKEVFVNPDALRNSATWQSLRSAINNEPIKSRTAIRPELTTSTTDRLARKELQIEVLAPSVANALGGRGGIDINGRRIQAANTMSAVVSIGFQGRRTFMFAGDVDNYGFDHMLREQTNINAEILVFPHHGGSPGSSSRIEFAERFCQAVNPRMVVFSIARSDRATPHPEIVAGLRKAVPTAHIACTQLSPQCATVLPILAPSYHTAYPARGQGSHCCCASTLKFTVNSQTGLVSPTLKEHDDFINTSATTALCRRNTIP